MGFSPQRHFAPPRQGIFLRGEFEGRPPKAAPVSYSRQIFDRPLALPFVSRTACDFIAGEFFTRALSATEAKPQPFGRRESAGKKFACARLRLNVKTRIAAAQASRQCSAFCAGDSAHGGNFPDARHRGINGRPNALVKVLSGLGRNVSVPVLLVQHITPSFLKGFVSWLDGISPLPVREAEDGQLPKAGHVYVATADKHLIVERGCLRLDAGALAATVVAAAHCALTLPITDPDALRDKLILVIDDESDARVLLLHLIDGYGCRVIAASSGEQGLRMAREFRPDLVTVDLIMPRMDGWQLIKKFKSDEQLKHIPIVVVSIVASEQAGKVFGAVDVVEKPLIRENLMAAFKRNLLSGKAKVLIVDDDPDARQLVTTCLAEEGMQTETATNGREALELLQRFSPDLIFLDLVMPEMDGISFLDHIRADSRYSHLPVVIITAKQLTPHEIQQLSSETRGIIRKSANLKENLRETLQRILQRDDCGIERLHVTA